MRWIPRLRMLLARRPWIFWLFVVTVALAIGGSVRQTVVAAELSRDRWGTSSVVLVADRRIAPGDRLDGAVSTRQFPTAMVPATATLQLPPDAIARHTIAAGEVIVGIDLAPDQGPVSLLPDDWLAVAVDDVTTEPFSVGENASVLAGGQIISPDAVVVQVLEHGVVVGVPSAAAAAVAEAANQHLATVALSASPLQR